jgi:hypothetical protein
MIMGLLAVFPIARTWANVLVDVAAATEAA